MKNTYKKYTKAEYKALFHELNEAHNTLCRVEDFLLDENNAHTVYCVAENAVLISYILRSKCLQMFNDEYPFIDKTEHYDITGRDQRY
jgi:hypothetical protein